jgi:thiol-disulfide isomerase/thioredoxin
MAAIPGARRTAGPRLAERPSLMAAAPVAGVLLALLIAAQVMFPPKTFEVSNPELAATIDMTVASDTSVGDTDGLSPDAQSHVVNRPTDEVPGDESESTTPDEDSTADRSVDDPETIAADDDSPAERSPKLSREVTFLKDRIKLDMYKEAVLGSPEAKYVVVELMDYTCPHCRKMHAHIREAMSRYGDQLAVVILPVPLELECNKMVAATDPAHRGACKIARTALAVGEVAPSKFLDFHNFLLANEEKVPSAGQAVVRGYQIVDRKRLKTRGASQEIEDRIQKDIRLYSALAAEHRSDTTFGLPVQIVGDTVLSGGEVTAEEMFEAWEKALGIKPL